ncbi:hypothetical protein [Pseudoalteromonas rubra]|uniref:hypothetical protein n=1 Tax=Pseudoalteromonas rubra TaxID=43658 RepID=UPI000F78A205|nr:hypothetical protein [Pseudoalteromonas rubra]
MKNNVIEISGLLRKALGFRLLSVFALVHTFDGEMDCTSPQELLFLFEGEFQFRVMCHQDGESIHVDSQPLVEVDMGAHGRNILCNCYDDKSFAHGVGKPVENIELIVSDKIIFGMLLLFSGGGSIVILNLGDDLYVYDELPGDIIEEENGKKLQVT